MVTPVTGTMLRDLVQCERRFELDLRGPVERRDQVSEFVAMLWEGGSAYEAEIVAGLQGRVVDLREVPAAEREAVTLAAMAERPDWIVGGRLRVGDRLGVPDLLRFEAGQWRAGDVKSGAAVDDAGRPRAEYRAQVGHYASIVADMGLGCRDLAFVIGREGTPTWYDLEQPIRRSDESINGEVDRLVDRARAVRDGNDFTRPALSSACSLCHWRSVCRADLEASDDLTLVAGLGRALRSVVEPVAPTVTALAGVDVAGLDAGRGKALPGLGMGRLVRFRDRARLLRTPGASPFARQALEVRRYPRELHFDIEAHPLMDGLTYLHGVLDVRGDDERYVSFFADRPEDEGEAFAAAWSFLTADPDTHIFYYSKFERTSYRVLAKRYPHVCSPEEVEELFGRGRSTDLLGDVVQPHTEWPTHGVGIKALAKHLGFSWRDVDPSGASSIAWFEEWLRTGDPVHKERLEAYNADDCKATLVLLKALVDLPVADAAAWGVAA